MFEEINLVQKSEENSRKYFVNILKNNDFIEKNLNNVLERIKQKIIQGSASSEEEWSFEEEEEACLRAVFTTASEVVTIATLLKREGFKRGKIGEENCKKGEKVRERGEKVMRSSVRVEKEGQIMKMEGVSDIGGRKRQCKIGNMLKDGGKERNRFEKVKESDKNLVNAKEISLGKEKKLEIDYKNQYDRSLSKKKVFRAGNKLKITKVRKEDETLQRSDGYFAEIGEVISERNNRKAENNTKEIITLRLEDKVTEENDKINVTETEVKENKLCQSQNVKEKIGVEVKKFMSGDKRYLTRSYNNKKNKDRIAHKRYLRSSDKIENIISLEHETEDQCLLIERNYNGIVREDVEDKYRNKKRKRGIKNKENMIEDEILINIGIIKEINSRINMDDIKNMKDKEDEINNSVIKVNKEDSSEIKIKLDEIMMIKECVDGERNSIKVCKGNNEVEQIVILNEVDKTESKCKVNKENNDIMICNVSEKFLEKKNELERNLKEQSVIMEAVKEISEINIFPLYCEGQKENAFKRSVNEKINSLIMVNKVCDFDKDVNEKIVDDSEIVELLKSDISIFNEKDDDYINYTFLNMEDNECGETIFQVNRFSSINETMLENNKFNDIYSSNINEIDSTKMKDLLVKSLVFENKSSPLNNNYGLTEIRTNCEMIMKLNEEESNNKIMINIVSEAEKKVNINNESNLCIKDSEEVKNVDMLNSDNIKGNMFRIKESFNIVNKNIEKVDKNISNQISNLDNNMRFEKVSIMKENKKVKRCDNYSNENTKSGDEKESLRRKNKEHNIRNYFLEEKFFNDGTDEKKLRKESEDHSDSNSSYSNLQGNDLNISLCNLTKMCIPTMRMKEVDNIKEVLRKTLLRKNIRPKKLKEITYSHSLTNNLDVTLKDGQTKTLSTNISKLNNKLTKEVENKSVKSLSRKDKMRLILEYKERKNKIKKIVIV